MMTWVELGPFDPERALASMTPEPAVVSRRLDGCTGMIDAGPPLEVAYDYRLGRRDRRAVLTHEFTHLDLDALYTRDTPSSIVEKIESRVRRCSTDRLVPPEQLETLARRAEEHDVPLHVWDLMEHFDVPMYVAHEAMALRSRRRR